jgi:hypothetical protein
MRYGHGRCPNCGEYIDDIIMRGRKELCPCCYKDYDQEKVGGALQTTIDKLEVVKLKDPRQAYLLAKILESLNDSDASEVIDATEYIGEVDDFTVKYEAKPNGGAMEVARAKLFVALEKKLHDRTGTNYNKSYLCQYVLGLLNAIDPVQAEHQVNGRNPVQEMLTVKDALVKAFKDEAGGNPNNKEAFLYDMLADHLDNLDTESLLESFNSSNYNT